MVLSGARGFGLLLRGARGRAVLSVLAVVGVLAGASPGVAPASVGRMGSLRAAGSAELSLRATLTWHKAADRAPFAVYRPRQTLGLKLSGLTFLASRCLVASYGSLGSRKGPHLGLYEPGNTSRCGMPGVATTVRKVVVNGVKVPILVQCPTYPKCTVKDGETNGIFLVFVPEHVGTHYKIQLQSSHVLLSDFLKVARSFTRVPKS